jgi:hypothetical protein
MGRKRERLVKEAFKGILDVLPRKVEEALKLAEKATK